MSTTESRTPSLADQLTACQRCRLRKIRCDHLGPKCSACAQASAACLVTDPVTGKQYSRSYLHDLECREQELLSQTRRQAEQSSADAVPETRATSRAFVGERSGVGLVRSMLSSQQWKPQNSHILQKLAARAPIPERSVAPNPPPPAQEAQALLQNYFARFHIHHTFLRRDHVWKILNSVYSGRSASAQDQFRLNMIFAISAVTRYRCGQTAAHPYGYYLVAQDYLANDLLVSSAEAIQNLLLVARFGMYYHIGTSLWEIGGFCMRQCVELGYHARPRTPLPAIREQELRRIFWESYVLDRYSSAILGRPFTIADEDVSVPLPLDVDDESLLALGGQSLANIAGNTFTAQPTEMSVFLCCIQLRRISSAIHTEFSANGQRNAAAPPQTLAGHVHERVAYYLESLDRWRETAPVFLSPQSLYERAEWFDFLMEKDKLSLLRDALAMAPRSRTNVPDDQLVDMCLTAAISVIELYSQLKTQGVITWTRSYFQIIFAAGLSMVYCLSVQKQQRIGDQCESDSAARTLFVCADILKSFGRDMVDVRGFAGVFMELRDLFLGRERLVDAPDSQIQRPGEDQTQPWPYGQSLLEPLLSDSVTGQPAQPEQDDLQLWLEGCPTFTSELLRDLEADLGEYAWGRLGESSDLQDMAQS